VYTHNALPISYLLLYICVFLHTTEIFHAETYQSGDPTMWWSCHCYIQCQFQLWIHRSSYLLIFQLVLSQGKRCLIESTYSCDPMGLLYRLVQMCTEGWYWVTWSSFAFLGSFYYGKKNLPTMIWQHCSAPCRCPSQNIWVWYESQSPFRMLKKKCKMFVKSVMKKKTIRNACLVPEEKAHCVDIWRRSQEGYKAS